MTYREALKWLYATQNHGIKLGLENVRALLQELDWHGRDQRFLHVAGTNGKGSVCAMLHAICRAQNLRTGLFTSPHLVTFCERLRLDDALISEAAVATGLTRIRSFVESWETPPTFFEITTALALDYFQSEKADVVVLETGLGGRLDSTNVVTPRVSVLTAIDLDHQSWLGETLPEIAAEKAGIIKRAVPVVSSPQADEVRPVLERAAQQQVANLRFVTQPLEKYDLALTGSHQLWNAALAVVALEAGQIVVTDEAIREGLMTMKWPGRFQIVEERIVLDGAHNPAAAARLAQTWREHFGAERATIIAGILQDKNITGICAALAPIASSFIAIPVLSPRTSAAAEVCAAVHEIPCRCASDFGEALALARVQPERILVTGSLFLIGEALAELGLATGAPEITAQ